MPNNFEQNPSAPNAHLPAEALSVHEINDTYDDMNSVEWRGKQARNFALEGWRLLEIGAADPEHALDIATARAFFSKAISITELDPQASDQETYRFAHLGFIAAPTFANRRPYQMLSADTLQQARYQNSHFLDKLLAPPPGYDNTTYIQAEQIAYDALLPRPIFPASPREHNGGAQDFYSLHHTATGVRSLGIDVKVIGKNIPEPPDGVILRVGLAIMEARAGQELDRTALNKQQVDAQMMAFAKLLIRESRGEQLDQPSQELIKATRRMLDNKWRRRADHLYPPV